MKTLKPRALEVREKIDAIRNQLPSDVETAYYGLSISIQ